MSPLFAPIAICVATTVAAHRWAIHPSFDVATYLSFGGTVASISTTMLGFMLAALAVLASINDTHLVKKMRDSGHYKDLLITMTFGSLVFTLCAVCGYALLFGVSPCDWFISLVVGLHVAALASLIDVGRKLWLVLSNLRS